MHSTGTSNQQQQQQQSTAESTCSVHSNSRNKPSTPQNTPAGENVNQNDGNNMNNDQADDDNGGDNGVLLCPRGLAAIPLLCAAASESRSAYLARLQVTHPSNGVSAITRLGRGCFVCLEHVPHNSLTLHGTYITHNEQTTLDDILFSGGPSKNHSVLK